MPEHLNARVEACYRQAEHFFQRSFPARPSASACAARKPGSPTSTRTCCASIPSCTAENREHFLEQTVAHEVART